MVDVFKGKGLVYAQMTALAGAVIGVFALQITHPVSSISQAPKTVLPLSETVIVSPAKIDSLEETQQVSPTNRISVTDVTQTFAQLDYRLSPVLEGKREVPRLFLARLPHDLDELQETQERKALFFKTMLPLVLKANEEIRAQRAKLYRLEHRKNLGYRLSSDQTLWLDGLYKRYGVPVGQIDTLLEHLDVIPTSLALAQAAEESGWGTSRFAREGNALFGQWTFNQNDKGLVPHGRVEGKTHRIKVFDSLYDSLFAYMTNLNRHKAYAQLRKKRAELRRQGQEINGAQLAQTLTQYSERGEKYVSSLLTIIEQNNLHQFDEARLDNGEIGDLNSPLI